MDTEFHRDVNGAKTKLEILNEQASIGAAKLLERLPNEKQSVPRLLLNCSIPRPLRHQVRYDKSIHLATISLTG